MQNPLLMQRVFLRSMRGQLDIVDVPDIKCACFLSSLI